MEKILKIQRRFFRNEKNQFLDTIEEKLTEYNYEFERKFFNNIFKSVNLETKCDKPDFIFIAHYDTGTIIPFWINWLTKLVGMNNIVLVMIFLYFLQEIIANTHSKISSVIFAIICISLLSIFIPNKKNFDDNTSGIIALLELAKKFKKNGIDNVKFIFADNEEFGLIGSNAHKKYLEKEQLIPSHCKVISIDCVGGKGEMPLIVQNSKSEYAKIFQREIQKEFELCQSINTIIPFSDNYSFRKYGALNISFASRAVVSSGYYIPNVHSIKDDKIDLDKIEKLTNILVKIINNINSMQEFKINEQNNF